MKLQIQIVTWNSEAVIGACLKAIRELDPKPDAVVVVDNNSQDSTRRILATFPNVRTILLDTNSGFTGGHNIAALSSSTDIEYFLCLNPDVILFSDALAVFQKALESSSHLGSMGGMLLKNELTGNKKISIVDTAGIRRLPTFQFIEIQPDHTSSHDPVTAREVFANSGACVCIPRSVLTKLNETQANASSYIFDNRFFAYKEDIDLAWRIRNSGLKNYITSQPVGTHIRTLKKEISFSERSEQHILLSYRNHLLLLSKHLTNKMFLKYGLFIGVYEIVKFLFLLFTHPKTVLRAIKEFRILKKENV